MGVVGQTGGSALLVLTLDHLLYMHHGRIDFAQGLVWSPRINILTMLVVQSCWKNRSLIRTVTPPSGDGEHLEHTWRQTGDSLQNCTPPLNQNTHLFTGTKRGF